MLPLAHADPADTARPSSRDASVSSVPSIDTFRLCGSRWVERAVDVDAVDRGAQARRAVDRAARRGGSPPRHLRRARAPRRRRGRRSPARSACPAAARARGRRRRTAARAAPSAGACARRARRRPAGRGSCAPRSTAGRCSSRSTSSGMRPKACAASVWNRMPRARVRRPIAASGCSTPISLLAAITLTRIVFGPRAASSAARSIRPSAPTGSTVTRQPRASRWRHVSSTARCSVATVTMWSPRSLALAATPLMARLSASVAPLVKTMSLCDAPIDGGDLAARRVDGVAGAAAGGVIEAGRVADLVAQQRQHRVEHARIDRRGGVGVQVDHRGIIVPRRGPARAPPPGSRRP